MFTATVFPTDAINRSVIWNSSDPSVATVDNTGKLRAIKVGTTVISIQTESGGFTDSFTLEIKKLICSESKTAWCRWAVVTDLGIIGVAYEVYFSISYAISEDTGSTKKLEYINAFTYTDADKFAWNLPEPNLSIGAATLNENDVIMLNNSDVLVSPNWRWVNKTGYPKAIVPYGAKITSTVTCMLDDALYPEQEVVLKITI